MCSEVNPHHYNKYAIQPYDFISKNGLDFTVGNIIKYAVRCKDKGGKIDAMKCKWYVEKLIDSFE